MATAPPFDNPLEYEIIELQRIIEELKEKNYNLNLALIKIEFQSLNSEVKKLENTVNNINATECNDQCEKANRQTETHTVDDFLKKDINFIFNI
jgi:hypothetical protein